MEGVVYWITGLSGAGKTTIGKELYRIMKDKRNSVIFLDGDELREVFGNDLGYTKEDRFKCAMRYAKLCDLISAQGIDVICCTISMFHEVRKWNRNHIENYKEIYIQVPLEMLKERNQKGLYMSVENQVEKDVAGLDLSVELPTCPDMIIDNIGNMCPKKLAENIFDLLIK